MRLIRLKSLRFPDNWWALFHPEKPTGIESTDSMDEMREYLNETG